MQEFPKRVVTALVKGFFAERLSAFWVYPVGPDVWEARSTLQAYRCAQHIEWDEDEHCQLVCKKAVEVCGGMPLCVSVTGCKVLCSRLPFLKSP